MYETRIDKHNGLLKVSFLPEAIIASTASFFIILFFYLLIFKFAVNVPFMDDFNAILGFTNNFFSSNLPRKFDLLFSQNNEHRILFSRLAGLASYYLTGKINFRYLIILGNLSLIGLLLVFLKATIFSKNVTIPPRFIIPAVLLLFQPQYHELIFRAMAPLSFILVLFFVFLSLCLLAKQSAKFFSFSLLLAILATFTNGNGMFIFPAGFFVLFIQKRYKAIKPWLFAGILCTGLYFIGYSKPAQNPSIAAAIFNNPFRTISYFFHFLGSAAIISFQRESVSLLTGILFSVYFVYLIKIKYFRINLAIFSFLLFLFITAVANSLCRSGFGACWPLIRSEYTLISMLCFISFYFSAIDILPKKVIGHIFPILLIGALFFNFYSYYKHYNLLVSHKANLINALSTKDFHYLYPDANQANAVISAAIAKGYYAPPSHI